MAQRQQRRRGATWAWGAAVRGVDAGVALRQQRRRGATWAWGEAAAAGAAWSRLAAQRRSANSEQVTHFVWLMEELLAVY
ncbi:hypothetical protein D7W09_05135 [bacterium D16-34]|nr:hypothetical protein D7W09_05135 [bacterium D16-34]